MESINIWNHFKTITEHKLQVMENCFRVGMYRQGRLHDLSKYSQGISGRGEILPGEPQSQCGGAGSVWLLKSLAPP